MKQEVRILTNHMHVSGSHETLSLNDFSTICSSLVKQRLPCEMLALLVHLHLFAFELVQLFADSSLRDANRRIYMKPASAGLAHLHGSMFTFMINFCPK